MSKINLSFSFKKGENLAAEIFLAGKELADNEVLVEYMTSETILRYDRENSSYSKDAYKFLKFNPQSQIDYSRLGNGIPVLRDHASFTIDAIIGSVVRADAQFMLLKIDSGSEEGQENLRKIKDGYWNSVSVGTEILDSEEIGTMSYEDEEWPVYEVTKHKPYELSFVAVPALAGAKVVSLSDFEKNYKKTLLNSSEPVISEVKPNDEELKKMTEEELRLLKLEAENAANVKLQGELQRQKTIRGYATELGFSDNTKLETLLDNAEVTPEKAKLEMFETLRKAEPIISGAAAPAVALNLQERNKNEKLAKAIEDRLATNVCDRELFGYSFAELLNDFLRSAGINKFGVARGNEFEILKTAYAANKEQLAHVSSDFNSLLVSSSNRLLENALVAANPTYQLIGKMDEQATLKTKTYTGTDLIGNLIQRNEGGQFVRTTLTESSKTMRPRGYGQSIAITKEMLINDDLGAFVEVLTEFTNALQRTRNNVFYGKLNTEVFVAARKTVATADEAGLATLRTFFKKYTITTADQKVVTLNPRLDIILAPVALEAALAKVIYGQLLANQASSVNSFQLLNTLNGLSTKLVTDPELDAFPVDYYGLQSPLAGKPAMRYLVYSGAVNGQVRNYLEEATESIVFQVSDYFDAIVNTQDTIVKADN